MGHHAATAGVLAGLGQRGAVDNGADKKVVIAKARALLQPAARR
jgi:hypothetical protein